MNANPKHRIRKAISVVVASSLAVASIVAAPSAMAWDNGNTAPNKTLSGASTLLNNPQGLALDADGQLYIANRNGNSVTVYAEDWASGNTAPIKTLTGGNTQLSAPEAVAVDPDGTLYVANATSVTVYASTWTGNTAPIKTLSGGATGLNAPSGIALDSTGAMYVANYNSSSVGVWAAGWSSGNTAPTKSLSGASTGLTNPNGITVGPDDTLYVASFFGDRIGMWEAGWASGNTAPNVNLSGGASDVVRPTGVAVDSAGNMYVSNVFANKVNLYAAGWGATTAPTKTLVGNLTGLNNPEGVATDSAGNLVVANGGNSVTYYSGGGDTDNEITFPQPPDTPLEESPLALTATASSDLPVTYTSSTTDVCTISGSNAVLVSAGTCTITASQGGDAIYSPATPVERSFEVTEEPVVEYTVTFDANGGTGTMAPQTSAAAATLTANTFTRTGYTFTNWNTAANGTGTTYADGAEYPFTANTTLYAQWEEIPPTEYTVTFDANGGTGTMAPQTSAAAATLTANTFTRTGYTFTNWNTAANGTGTTYADGAEYPFTANTTLYAQWEEIPPTEYTVTFDANGGTGTMAPQTSAAAATLTANTFTRDGYTFTNWNTAANGTGDTYADGAEYPFTANTTLYAQWEAVSPSVQRGMAITWGAPAMTDVEGYEVQYSTDNATWFDFESGECAGTLPSTELSCFATTADGLQTGLSYYFQIFSVKDGARTENAGTTDSQVTLTARSASQRSGSADAGAISEVRQLGRDRVLVPGSIWRTWTALNNPYQLCISKLGKSLGCQQVLNPGRFSAGSKNMTASTAKVRNAGIIQGQSFNVIAPMTFSKKTRQGALPKSMLIRIHAASSLGTTTTLLSLSLTPRGPNRTLVGYQLKATGTGIVRDYLPLQNSPRADRSLGRDIAQLVTAGKGKRLYGKLSKPTPSESKGKSVVLRARFQGASALKGNVTFWQGNKALCTRNVRSDGTATCRVTLTGRLKLNTWRGDAGNRRIRLSVTLAGTGRASGQNTPVEGYGSQIVRLR